MMKCSGSAFIIASQFILIFMLLSSIAICQEQEYTDFERERFELDLVFEAEILLDDGTKFTVSNFHLSKWLLRHKLQTGDERQGINLPLSNIKRIVRSKNTKYWVDVVFLNDTEMHTHWFDPGIQRLYGALEDGSEWESSIDRVREIVIRLVDDGSKEK
jgi:hypothetical protein